MKTYYWLASAIVGCLLIFARCTLHGIEPQTSASSFSLHPENPRYFMFRGKPTVLVTSAEHYGLLLNKAMDYRRYFEELTSHGLNHSRVFSGAYREEASAFNITENTLAPSDQDYLAPWARATGTKGQEKSLWDLTKWNEDYFRRLHDIVALAAEHGIVLEVTLFCPMYDPGLWAINPMNASNNVNGIGACESLEVYTGQDIALTNVQTALAQKLVRELVEFDNIYFEICNEPYFGGVTDDWQRRIIDAMVEMQQQVGCKKLISLNIANGSQRIEDPHPAVSLFNFHYCHPPVAVAENWHLNKPIGENETGFRGPHDFLYRTEGWDFILAGGALFNNLDYSFSSSHPAGTLRDYRSPGGGSLALRHQLGTLKNCVASLPLPNVTPQPAELVETSADLTWQCLGQAGLAYLLYVHRKIPEPLDQAALEQLHAPHPSVELTLQLPAETYDVVRINPVSGERGQLPKLTARDQPVSVILPDFHWDAALLITKATSDKR